MRKIYKLKHGSIEAGAQAQAVPTYRKFPQYAGMISANLLKLAIGNALGWVSPAGPQLLQGAAGFPIDEHQNSWIASLLAIGTATSFLPIGYLSDKFGKKAIMLGSVPLLLVGWGLIIWATSVEMIYAGRFICGISEGSAYFVTAYTAEISHKDIRGEVASYNGVFSYIGITIAYVLGSFFKLYWMSVICAIVPIIFGISFVFFPDSPVFYLTKNRPEDARNSLRFFRGPDYDVEPEFQELAAAIDQRNREGDSKWSEYTSKVVVRGLTICICLVVIQQLSGVGTYIAYTDIIFQFTDSSLDPNYAAIVFGLVSIVANWLMTLLVDRIGRVTLLITSGATMAISNIVLGAYFYLQQNQYKTTNLDWIPLVSLCVFISMYSIGFGPVPEVLMAELLPAKTKGAAQSIAFTFLTSTAFLLMKFFFDLNNAVGLDGTFWMYAIVCAIGAVFSYFIVPETKGKSFEEILRNSGGGNVEEVRSGL